MSTNVFLGVIGNTYEISRLFTSKNIGKFMILQVIDKAKYKTFTIRKNFYLYTPSKNILFLQFIGVRFFLYHLPNEQDNKMECPIDYYRAPVGNSGIFLTHVYDKE